MSNTYEICSYDLGWDPTSTTRDAVFVAGASSTLTLERIDITWGDWNTPLIGTEKFQLDIAVNAGPYDPSGAYAGPVSPNPLSDTYPPPASTAYSYGGFKGNVLWQWAPTVGDSKFILDFTDVGGWQVSKGGYLDVKWRRATNLEDFVLLFYISE